MLWITDEQEKTIYIIEKIVLMIVLTEEFDYNIS